MTATKIRQLCLVTLAPLLLAACGDSSTGDVPVQPPPLPLPARCHLVSDLASSRTLQALLLPTDQGTFATWLEYSGTGPVRATLAVTELDETLEAAEPARVLLGAGSMFDTSNPLLITPVGGNLFVVAGDVARLVPLSDPAALTAIDVGPMDAAAALALDDQHVALLDTTPDGRLRYRVLDIQDGAFTLEAELADTAIDFSAAPLPLILLGQTLRLLRLANGDLLALWVDEGDRARVLRFRADGTLVAGPADAAHAVSADLYLPDAVETESGDIAIAWTGSSGAEVRAALLPATLQTEAGTGVVVNATTEGSQEYARIFFQDGTLRVAWNTLGNGIRRRDLEIADGVLAPIGSDADAASGCASELQGDLSVTSDGEPTTIWIDRGWAGPPRVLVERVR